MAGKSRNPQISDLVASALDGIAKQKPSSRQGRTGKVHIWDAIKPRLPEIWQAIGNGVTRRIIHSRLKKAGIEVSYSSFTSWLKRNPLPKSDSQTSAQSSS